MKKFKSEIPQDVKICVIGIPGPVDDERNTAVCPMIPRWPEVEGIQIKDALGLQKCVLINDFIAAGYGVASLHPNESVQLNSGCTPKPNATKIVIGPGTGLGEALLLFNTSTS